MKTYSELKSEMDNLEAQMEEAKNANARKRSKRSNYCVRNLASPPACCKAYWPRAAIARQKPKAF